MHRSSRRDFLIKSAAAASAGAIVGYFPGGRAALAANGPNDRLGIASIGLGRMGRHDARDHKGFGDILAVCDVDSRHADEAKNDEKIGQGKADAYGDYRKVFERKDIDVVSIATVDHWHVKIAIEALQAGKHVFCQKPLTLTLEENQLIRNACQKYDSKAFEVGTQQRSSKEYFLRAVNMVHKGLLGDITKITCSIGAGPAGGPFQKEAPPAELDWEMWLGQTPKVDYMANRCHEQFRWWYEYSGGKFTDWGAHHVDIATWAIQQDKKGLGPIEIDGTEVQHPVPFKDGYPTVDNCYNTSNKFTVKCKYPSGVELFLTDGDEGILFEGTKGRIYVNRQKITGTPIEENWDKDQFGPDDLVKLYKGKPYCSHKESFYRSVREGGLPVSDVFSHVIAMNTCHLAGIAGRLGRVIKWDPAQEKIVGDNEAAAFFARTQRSGFEIPRV